MNAAYIFLANGFETVEALGTADVLRRGGVETKLVSTQDSMMLASSHRIRVEADCCFADINPDLSDVLVFPGGMPGSKNLAENAELIEFARRHFSQGGKVAAICAAPGLVGGQLDGLEGRHFTCFDGFQELPLSRGAVFTPSGAITDGNLITGRSAGYYIDFGLEILRSLRDEATAEKVRAAMLLDTTE